MRYCIATWNYLEPGAGTLGLIEQFADVGFDAVSFLPRQILQLDDRQREGLKSLLEARSLAATVHGNFELTGEQVAELLDVLGEALRCLTMDALTDHDHGVRRFNARAMAELLGEIEARSRGTDLRFGVEDFPLDGETIEEHRRDLQPLLACPRYGMLIDVGHMNIRRHGADSGSVQECLARAPRPVIEVHLHDNAGQKDSHGHFGFGNIRFEDVASGLAAIGFDGVATIEIGPSLHGSTPSASRPRVAESLAVWRRLWAGASAGG